MPTVERNAILVVGPSWVGDMIMAQSLFKVLRQRMPEAAIDVLAPAWSHGILARMPEVRRALVAPFTHGSFGLRERWRLGRDLAREGYSQAIVLPNSWKSALLPLFAGIPVRSGYLGEFRHGLLNDARKLDKTAVPRLVDRYAALALPAASHAAQGAAQQPRLTVNPAAQLAALTRLGLVDPEHGTRHSRESGNPEITQTHWIRDQVQNDRLAHPSGHINTARPILALCPGAEYGPAKRWPEHHYAAVARAKLEDGWQVWLFGSARDKTVTDAITALTGTANVHNLAGLTTLEETVDLLACAHAVVSNDSGLMHIAAAVDVPLVAVYGSTDPGYTPPYSDKARIVRLGLPCSPCFKRECPLGHLDCLNNLLPERVLEVLPT